MRFDSSQLYLGKQGFGQYRVSLRHNDESLRHNVVCPLHPTNPKLDSLERDFGLERAFGSCYFLDSQEFRPRVRNRRGATSDNVGLRFAKLAFALPISFKHFLVFTAC